VRHIPNLLSIARLAMAPYVFTLIWRREYGMVLIFFVLAGITDGLDGLIARRFQANSRAGAYLDPIADKVLLSGSFLTLALDGAIEARVAYLVLGRDLLILLFAAGVMLSSRVPPSLPPSIWGKVSTAVQIAFVVALVTHFVGFAQSGLVVALRWMTVAFTILSAVDYAVKAPGIIQRARA
jgi:cardiolipin synthase